MLNFNGSGSDLATDVLAVLGKASFDELDRFVRSMLGDERANLAARLHFHVRCGMKLQPSHPDPSGG